MPVCCLGVWILPGWHGLAQHRLMNVVVAPCPPPPISVDELLNGLSSTGRRWMPGWERSPVCYQNCYIAAYWCLVLVGCVLRGVVLGVLVADVSVPCRTNSWCTGTRSVMLLISSAVGLPCQISMLLDAHCGPLSHYQSISLFKRLASAGSLVRHSKSACSLVWSKR